MGDNVRKFSLEKNSQKCHHFLATIFPQKSCPNGKISPNLVTLLSAHPPFSFSQVERQQVHKA
jgi:hypothetical protein